MARGPVADASALGCFTLACSLHVIVSRPWRRATQRRRCVRLSGIENFSQAVWVTSSQVQSKVPAVVQVRTSPVYTGHSWHLQLQPTFLAVLPQLAHRITFCYVMELT